VERSQDAKEHSGGDEHDDGRLGVERERGREQYQEGEGRGDQPGCLQRAPGRLSHLAGHRFLHVPLTLARLHPPRGRGEGAEQLVAQSRLHVGCDPGREDRQRREQSGAGNDEHGRDDHERAGRGMDVKQVRVLSARLRMADQGERDADENGEKRGFGDAGENRAERQQRDRATAGADEDAHQLPRRGFCRFPPGVRRKARRRRHQTTGPLRPAPLRGARTARPGPASQWAATPAANQKYGPPAEPAENAPANPVTVRPASTEKMAARNSRTSRSSTFDSRRTTSDPRYTVNATQRARPGKPTSFIRKLYSVSELKP